MLMAKQLQTNEGKIIKNNIKFMMALRISMDNAI